MVKYSAYTDIEFLSGTTYTQSTLEKLIEAGERDIDTWLADANMTGTAGNAHLKQASIDMGLYYLSMRMDLDGTKPNQLSIGELTMQSNVDGRMNMLKENAKESVATFVKENGNDPYDDTDADFEDTAVRNDHNMSDMNLSQETIPDYSDKADNLGRNDDLEV